ncbi:MAG: hypothetical protein QOC99_393 [Acidobacteriota bacterium]|nr:hypothetical protein [Acidobacteriota bacterium]
MRASLRVSPEHGRRLLGMIPDELLKRMQAAHFSSTLRLVAESSTFYRNEFKRRGIEVRRVGHPRSWATSIRRKPRRDRAVRGDGRSVGAASGRGEGAGEFTAQLRRLLEEPRDASLRSARGNMPAPVTYQGDRQHGEQEANNLTQDLVTFTPDSAATAARLGFPGARLILTNTGVGGGPAFAQGQGTFLIAPPLLSTDGSGVANQFAIARASSASSRPSTATRTYAFWSAPRNAWVLIRARSRAGTSWAPRLRVPPPPVPVRASTARPST